MVKKTYKITGMHCTSCALVIASDLEDIGVTARCNYATSALDVEYDDARVTEDAIRKAVRSAGYDLAE